MKKICIIACVAIALFASCSTPTITINTEPPTKDVNISVTADLEISKEKISYTYTQHNDGAVENAKNCAIVKALKNYGDADILIAPQYEIKITGYDRIEVKVSGYPAKYKNLRSVSLDGVISNNTLDIGKNTHPSTSVTTSVHNVEIQSEQTKQETPIVVLTKEAEENLIQTAKNGNIQAQYELGYYYFQFSKKDPDNVTYDHYAKKWLKKAAEQGHKDAQYELGCCYWNQRQYAGYGKIAKNWLKKAAEQGHKEAAEMLKNL